MPIGPYLIIFRSKNPVIPRPAAGGWIGFIVIHPVICGTRDSIPSIGDGNIILGSKDAIRSGPCIPPISIIPVIILSAKGSVWAREMFTPLIIKRGFLYLTAVIDWYSRCIVGWEVDDTLDTRMVINALKKAFKTAKPVILNSDQGCQFTSNEYMNFLKENQIRQSMDGKSRWADNIMIERWFRSFKYEEAYLTQYANIREARKAIGKYIHTYNFERCHSAINNQTPASYYYPVLLIEYAA